MDSQSHRRAVTLEVLGDIPDADMRPPETSLFVCKLNPITEEDDLKLIFSRFGEIVSCNVVKDWKTGQSLQYAFIEYKTKEACDKAYSKMQNVFIDDRRVVVTFSQSSVSLWKEYRSQKAKHAKPVSNQSLKPVAGTSHIPPINRPKYAGRPHGAGPTPGTRYTNGTIYKPVNRVVK